MSSDDSAIFPAPRMISYGEGIHTLYSSLDFQIPHEWRSQLAPELTMLAAAVSRLEKGKTTIQVLRGNVPASGSGEAYRLQITPETITLTAQSVAGARYGLRTIRKLENTGLLHCCEIQDWPNIPFRGVQFDLGRVIERPEVIERLIPLYASMNYNTVQLYLENAYVYSSHPKLARKNAWTMEQAMRVVDTATRYGITVIPALQVLGHCDWLTSNPDYKDLDERRASGGSGVLCPSSARTKEVLAAMIHDVAPLATSGIIHLGMDESPVLGQCELCKPIRMASGEGGVFAMHANNVAAIVREVGKRPAIWGDMFHYFPESIGLIDRNIIVFDWYYYTFDKYPRIDIFDNEPWDSVDMLQKHNIESWGCPSSFYTSMMPYCLPDESIENCRDWTRYIIEKGERGIMVTQWELTTATIDMTLPIEGAVAGFMWGNELDTPSAELLRRSCNELYGCPELAPLLEEIGIHRFHGHCARRWLNAADIAYMITYDESPQDIALAERFDIIADTCVKLAERSKQPEMVAAFTPASRWLSYQYRKHSYINQAALLVDDGNYVEASTLIARLSSEANVLAEIWEAEWLRNRYKDDHMPIPQRMLDEARIFNEEITLLNSAIQGGSYSGKLAHPILAIRLIDTFGTCCMVSVEISSDGMNFKELDSAWILQFDSEAMGGRRAAEMNYNFPINEIDEARFVRITAFGTGHFSLKSVNIHRGKKRWGIRSVKPDGQVKHADALLAGGLAELGCPDSKQLFLEQAALGDSGKAFSKKHGSITVELASVDE